ncbi:MAG: 4Fe-4S binding protein [Candidatus Methanomethylophilaceae archaeon]|nr:4Fe-4S binding protein [Candidatus Methanomethylophilaceae archaeon]MBR2348657.1 4Fe-4S binding protein [Candidatus Methanomethylophilaceae archaeon]
MAIRYLDKYPKNLAKSLWVMKPTIVVLKLFIKNIFHRPVTVLYPYEKEWIPDNYRGRPGLRFDKCVGCGMCVRACPTACIKLIEVEDDNGKAVMRPQVNVGRCAMCGYCAEYCPVDAMTVTPEYELAEYSRYDLLYGPRRLHYEGTTEGMEVKCEVTLPSDIANGNPERRVSLFDLDRPELIDKKCIGCKKCAKVCPVNAIEMVEKGVNDKGRPILRPVIDNVKCISCRNCVIDCPKDALEIKEVL